MKTIKFLLILFVLTVNLKSTLVLKDTYLIDDDQIWKTEFYDDGLSHKEACVVIYFKNGTKTKRMLG